MAHGNIYAAGEDRRRARQLLPRRQPRRRCASSPCCGSPTASTRPSSDTGSDQGIKEPWPTRERVVVALTGGAEPRDPAAPRCPHRDPERRRRPHRLPRSVDRGPDHDRPGRPRAPAATHPGASAASSTRSPAPTSRRRSSTTPAASTRPRSSSVSADAAASSRLLRPSIASEVADDSGDIDVLLVTHGEAGRGAGDSAAGTVLHPPAWSPAGCSRRSPCSFSPWCSSRRRSCTAFRSRCCSTSPSRSACALVGGIWPALFARSSARSSSTGTSPSRWASLTIDNPPNALALLVFMLIAGAVVVGRPRRCAAPSRPCPPSASRPRSPPQP